MPDAQTETPNEAGREPTSSEVQKQLEELEQHEDDPGAANDTFDKKINEVDQSARKRWEDMSGRLLDINRAIAGVCISPICPFFFFFFFYSLD